MEGEAGGGREGRTGVRLCGLLRVRKLMRNYPRVAPWITKGGENEGKRAPETGGVKGPAWDRKHPSSSGRRGRGKGTRRYGQIRAGRDKEEASGSREH